MPPPISVVVSLFWTLSLTRERNVIPFLHLYYLDYVTSQRTYHIQVALIEIPATGVLAYAT